MTLRAALAVALSCGLAGSVGAQEQPAKPPAPDTAPSPDTLYMLDNGSGTLPVYRRQFIVRFHDTLSVASFNGNLAESGAVIKGGNGGLDLVSREGSAPSVLRLVLKADTVLPPVPDNHPPPDTAFAIQSPDGYVFYRRQFVVMFPDSVSGATVTSFLGDYGAVVVRGDGVRNLLYTGTRSRDGLGYLCSVRQESLW